MSSPPPPLLLPHAQPLTVEPTRHVFEPLRQESPVPRRAFAAPHSRAFQFLDSELCELGDASDSYFRAVMAPTNNHNHHSGNATAVVQPGQAIVPTPLQSSSSEQLPSVQAPRLAPPAFRLLFAESYRSETGAAAYNSGSSGGFSSGGTMTSVDTSSRGSAFETNATVQTAPPLEHVPFAPMTVMTSTSLGEQWPVLDPFNNSDRTSFGYDNSVDSDSTPTGGLGLNDTISSSAFFRGFEDRVVAHGGHVGLSMASSGVRHLYPTGVSHNDTNVNHNTSQFATATWTRPQHFAPAASAIHPSLRATTSSHAPDFSVFRDVQQPQATAPLASTRDWRIQDTMQEPLVERLSPVVSPIRSHGSSAVSSPLWRVPALARPPPLAPPVNRPTMSVEEQNEELTRAAHTLISDDFLRGVSDVHVFSRGPPTAEAQLTQWQLQQQQQQQLQQQLHQQLQRQEQQQQLQPLQQSYVKLDQMSNGHMVPARANRIGDSALSHAPHTVEAETRVGVKRKPPVKRKRATDANAGGQRPAQMPVPTYSTTAFATTAATAPPTAATVRVPVLSTSGAGNDVARLLAPYRPPATSIKPTFILPVTSASTNSAPGPTVPKEKRKKKANAGRAHVPLVPTLSKEMIANGWFVPESDGKTKKKKAPPTKPTTVKDEPLKHKPRKAAAPPLHKPSLQTGIPVDALPLALIVVSSPRTTPLEPSTSTPSVVAPAVPAAASDATVVTNVKHALEMPDWHLPAPTPGPSSVANADVATPLSPTSDAVALADVVWSRAANATATTEVATLATPVSPLPSPHANNTVVIFCKRDFLRYQAAKLWKKYEEKKRKKEFQTVQVLGKRTRYVNARYEDEHPAPVVRDPTGGCVGCGVGLLPV